MKKAEGSSKVEAADKADKTESTDKVEATNKKSISVSDVDVIEVTVNLNGVDTKASFNSVIDAYEKMRVWHKQIVKGKDDHFRVNYAVSLGTKDDDPYIEKGLPAVSGIDWKTFFAKSDYIVSKREFDFSDWVSWIADRIRTDRKLKGLAFQSTPYLEIHVSWNVWRGYFHLRRRRKGLLVDHTHDIMESSWNTRAQIVLRLSGYDWPFVYKNSHGEAHYYHGTLQSIHQELTRLATAAYEISNSRSTITQAEALEALCQFYAKYPDFQKTLTSNYYLIEDIVQLAAPRFDESLRKPSMPLLHLIPPKETIQTMERIYHSLSEQLKEWKHIIEVNKSIIERNEVKEVPDGK